MCSSYSSVASVLSPWAVKYAIAGAPRLRHIPPRNAEHGVVRAYLEYLLRYWCPPAASSEALALSDFLVNSIIARRGSL